MTDTEPGNEFFEPGSTETAVTLTNADPSILVGPTEERMANDNDQQMLKRWDGAWGPSITRRALEQEAKFAEQNEGEALIRPGSINEPVPLMTVNADGDMDLHNPVRIEPLPPDYEAPMPELPPSINEPPAEEESRG